MRLAALALTAATAFLAMPATATPPFTCVDMPPGTTAPLPEKVCFPCEDCVPCVDEALCGKVWHP